MHKSLLLILLWLVTTVTDSCRYDSVNNQLKEKLYLMEIFSGKVMEKIEVGHGDFILIYKVGNTIDTVPFIRQHSYFDQIDSQTIIYKKRKSYDLELQNLVRKNIRHNETVQLTY